MKILAGKKKTAGKNKGCSLCLCLQSIIHTSILENWGRGLYKPLFWKWHMWKVLFLHICHHFSFDTACVRAKSPQPCPTLCDPMGSLPGSSVHGILQARILQWVAMPSSRGSSQPQGPNQVSCIAGRFFTIRATREAQNLTINTSNFLQTI